MPVTPQMAKLITRYLIKNDYTDTNDTITTAYHNAKKDGFLAALPAELVPHAAEVYRLIDSVYSKDQLPDIDDGRNAKTNPLNANYHKQAFRELWSRIHQKAVYSVNFDTRELVERSVNALDAELKVAPLQYVVQRGQQTANTDRIEYCNPGNGYSLAVPMVRIRVRP